MSFATSIGVPLSPGALSTSVGAGFAGFVSSSAMLISASFTIGPPGKRGSTWNVIVVAAEVPAAIKDIGVFNVAVAPAAVQFASANINPVGIKSTKPTLKAFTAP